MKPSPQHLGNPSDGFQSFQALLCTKKKQKNLKEEEIRVMLLSHSVKKVVITLSVFSHRAQSEVP